ncbi:hypothetical protein PTKIN_Ptkin08bG0044500 [Pterospermum kingtungense]
MPLSRQFPRFLEYFQQNLLLGVFQHKSIGSTRVGPAGPQIDLEQQNKDVIWSIFGANSMVQVSSDVLCLGFVDGGLNPKTSIVIGEHLIEDNLVQFDLVTSRLGFSSSLLFRQTTCANFNFHPLLEGVSSFHSPLPIF